MEESKKPLFTVDLEDYFHAIPGLNWDECERRIFGNAEYLFRTLADHDVKATVYVLGAVADEIPFLVDGIRADGHVIGSHGYFHQRHSREGDQDDAMARQAIIRCSDVYRSPYWDTTKMPGFSGGFFFRALPYALFKSELMRSGVFWIHPHDLDEGHPKLKNPLLNIKRHIGLKGIRNKLERLLKDVSWRTDF